MNIGIDARGLLKKKAGIGIYIEQLIKNLNDIDDNNNYILYSTKEIILNFKLRENFVIKQNLNKNGSFWMYYCLPKILKKDKIDVFLGTQTLLPKRNKYTKDIKYILTIHDLAIKKLKYVGSTKNTIIQKLFLKKSIKNADKIIAISNATKNDIINIFNIKEEKIKVIYQGTNEQEIIKEITKKEEIEIKKKFNIESEPYILFVSTIEPRKNIETLIKAYEYIRENESMKFKLILAGGLGWKYKNVLDMIEKSKYKSDIEISGYITDIEKKYLLKNAKCFVYPSLYEGFGLPILEAMVNKAIVVTSNISAIPEVGGDVAFYYNNVLDYIELSKTIIKVLNLNNDERQIKIEQGMRTS